MARERINSCISRNFRGHDYARLVAAVLQAQGFKTRLSPPGADGGIDILAGKGALGYESPRIVVQVKSGAQVANQSALQSLTGNVADMNADFGLLVSEGGLTKVVMDEMQARYFEIKLWNGDDLLDQLLRHADGLPEGISSELPLRRIWILDEDEEEFP